MASGVFSLFFISLYFSEAPSSLSTLHSSLFTSEAKLSLRSAHRLRLRIRLRLADCVGRDRRTLLVSLLLTADDLGLGLHHVVHLEHAGVLQGARGDVLVLRALGLYFFASCVMLVAAMRPDTRISVRALPPKRLPPWMPPVTSPAA